MTDHHFSCSHWGMFVWPKYSATKPVGLGDPHCKVVIDVQSGVTADNFLRSRDQIMRTLS
jgi:hypothetical protein